MPESRTDAFSRYSLRHAFRLGYPDAEKRTWPLAMREHHDKIVSTIKDFISRGVGKRGRRYQNIEESGKALFSYLSREKRASAAHLMVTFHLGTNLTHAWRGGKDVRKGKK